MKICPIMSSLTGSFSHGLTRCRENECALWNNGCAIVQATKALTVLSEKNESTSTATGPSSKPSD